MRIVAGVRAEEKILLAAGAVGGAKVENSRPVAVDAKRGPKFQARRRTPADQSAGEIDIGSRRTVQSDGIADDGSVSTEGAIRSADGVGGIGGKRVAMGQSRVGLGQIQDLRVC